MTQNLVSQHLSDDQWARADAAITELAAALEPMLVSVTRTNKKTMVKMGEASEVFCRQAVDVMQENLHLMPRGFDLEEMRHDLQSHDALNARIVRLTRLLEQARNAEMALGSDVMVSALEGYAVLKAVGKGAGVQALTRQLGRRFEASPRETSVPVPKTPM